MYQGYIHKTYNRDKLQYIFIIFDGQDRRDTSFSRPLKRDAERKGTDFDPTPKTIVPKEAIYGAGSSD